jgi:hypothetical protein
LSLARCRAQGGSGLREGMDGPGHEWRFGVRYESSLHNHYFGGYSIQELSYPSPRPSQGVMISS